jgi:hypothetical protein
MRQTEREKRLAALEVQAERSRALPRIPAIDVWWSLLCWQPLAYYLGGRWCLCAPTYPIAKRYAPVTAQLAALGYDFDAHALQARCEDLNRAGLRLADLIADLDDAAIVESVGLLVFNDNARFDGPGHLASVQAGADRDALAPLVERFNALHAGHLFVPLWPEEARAAAEELRAGRLMLTWDHQILVSPMAPDGDAQCARVANVANSAVTQQTGERFQTTDALADWLDTYAEECPDELAAHPR